MDKEFPLAKLDELPRFAGRDTPKDERERISFSFIIQPGTPHLRRALAQSLFDVILLGFQNHHERRLQDIRRFTTGQDEITLPLQAALFIDIQQSAREDSQVMPQNRAAGHEDRGDNEFAAGFFTGHGQVLSFVQCLPQPRGRFIVRFLGRIPAFAGGSLAKRWTTSSYGRARRYWPRS